MTNSFKDFNLNAALNQALEGLGFEKPTEIQAKSLPLLLTPAKVDFHGQAQTGTGKTLAFGLPLLNKIDSLNRDTQALIVAPTRELVVQICQSLRQVAQHMRVSIQPIYGGASMHEQLRALKNGAQIVVGTPGRLNDHLRRKTLSLKNLDVLVFDEADIMLDMGFKDEVDEILNYAPAQRQIWLFSATVKPGIDQIKKKYMKNALVVSASPQQIGCGNTKQYYCIVPARQKTESLARFIDSVPEFYGFVFCQTKMLAIEVTEHLARLGYKVGSLHGDMSQVQRNRMIKQFKNREFTVLIATDIAARGLDINDITHVVNYSLPSDQESYIHRIGRTGRAGKLGIAITFITKTEQYKVMALTRRFRVTIESINVPSEQQLMNMQLQRMEDFLQVTQEVAQGDKANLDHIVGMLGRQEPQRLKEVLATLLKDKFFKQFTPQPVESSQFASPTRQVFDDALDANMQELCLNVGAQDGVTKGQVIDYVRTKSEINQNSISKVRVIRHRTFLVVDAGIAHQLKGDLEGHTLGGRTVRVNMA